MVVATVISLPSGVARADANTDEAAELFRSASAAFRRGEYRAAAVAFEEAHRRVPHGVAMYNAATAWDSAGDKPRAADAFAAALRTPGLEGSQRRDAQAKLAALELALGLVRIEGPSDARVSLAHVAGAAPPTAVHVAPGEYPLTIVRADGRRDDGRVRVGVGETTTFTVKAAEPVRSVAPPQRRRWGTSAPVDEPSGGVQRAVGWAGLGLAAVAFGTGVYMGVEALSARDDFEASERYDRDAHDRADRFRIGANIAWAGAGVFAVAGVVLLLTAPRASQRLTSRTLTF
jgi:hypothetical protein